MTKKGEKKEKRKNETGERSFQQESFSAIARAEIGVTVANFVLLRTADG